MAELLTVTIELEPNLLKEIDRLAAYEPKGRGAVVREAIVRHIETMTEMEDLKQFAAEKYLNGHSVSISSPGLWDTIMPWKFRPGSAFWR